MGNRMSSGKIQAKIWYEIRSVDYYFFVVCVCVCWMEDGEKCKVKHSILALVYASILEGQKACYSGQTLAVHWCCILINLLFSSKSRPVSGPFAYRHTSKSLHLPLMFNFTRRFVERPWMLILYLMRIVFKIRLPSPA